jgi:hypothetical protein
MNRLISSKPLLAAAIAFGTLAAASAAHARSDVFFSVGAPAPAQVYVEPHRVYVQPQPVYVQPESAYYERQYREHQQPPYVQPQAVYVRPESSYYERQYREHEHERRGEWRDGDRYDHRYNARVVQRHGPWGDADGDGVPNRFDREPFNPYRR